MWNAAVFANYDKAACDYCLGIVAKTISDQFRPYNTQAFISRNENKWLLSKQGLY